LNISLLMFSQFELELELLHSMQILDLDYD
jgi:hypothetical protein